MSSIFRHSFDTACRVEVEHSDENLCAHVELDGGIDIQPGDEVLVHGAPIVVGFGERRVERRQATVTRAGLAERLWTRLAGHFEMTELYEVSFTDRRLA